MRLEYAARLFGWNYETLLIDPRKFFALFLAALAETDNYESTLILLILSPYLKDLTKNRFHSSNLVQILLAKFQKVRT